MYRVILHKKENTTTPNIKDIIYLTEKHSGIFLYTTPHQNHHPCRWIVGLNPLIIHNGETITYNDTVIPDSKMKKIDEVVQNAQIDSDIPLWLGYVGWDFKNTIEEPGLYKEAKDENFDVAQMIVYQHVWVIHPETNKATLFTFNIEGLSSKNQFDWKLKQSEHHENSFTVTNLKTNISKNAYIEKVKSIQEHIKAGDIYQANLTREITGDFEGNTAYLVQKLLESNNIEFAAYIHTSKGIIVSTSPERFFKIDTDTITVSPIKGTIQRGKDLYEDEKYKTELLNDIKNHRELAMIVDLLRNDISRISKAGTVKVLSFPELKTLQNVFHLVADITGKVTKRSFSEIISAIFPGGSISGCPKIRACQIIETLEPKPRGPYTGTMGYICGNGDMDFNILIRTLFQYGNKIQFNVGGGITLLSDPKDEFEETCHKAKNILKALNTSEKHPEN